MMDPSSGIPLSSCFVRQHCNFFSFFLHFFFLLERLPVQLAEAAGVTRATRLARKISHMMAWCDSVVYPHVTFPVRWARGSADLATRLCASCCLWKERVTERLSVLRVFYCCARNAGLKCVRRCGFSYSLIISILPMKQSSLYSPPSAFLNKCVHQVLLLFA